MPQNQYAGLADAMRGMSPEASQQVIQTATQAMLQQQQMGLEQQRHRDQMEMHRKQMKAQERHREHERQLAKEKFDLMQDQFSRQVIMEDFQMNMEEEKLSIQEEKLGLERLITEQQLELGEMEIDQAHAQLAQLERMENMVDTFQQPYEVYPGFSIPAGMMMNDRDLAKTVIEMRESYLEEHGETDLSAAEETVHRLGQDIRRNMIGAAGNNAEERLAAESVPDSVLRSDARIFENMSQTDSIASLLQAIGNNPGMISEAMSEEGRARLLTEMDALEEERMNQIFIGEGPTARWWLQQQGHQVNVDDLEVVYRSMELAGDLPEDHPAQEALAETIKGVERGRNLLDAARPHIDELRNLVETDMQNQVEMEEDEEPDAEPRPQEQRFGVDWDAEPPEDALKTETPEELKASRDFEKAGQASTVSLSDSERHPDPHSPKPSPFMQDHTIKILQKDFGLSDTETKQVQREIDRFGRKKDMIKRNLDLIKDRVSPTVFEAISSYVGK